MLGFAKMTSGEVKFCLRPTQVDKVRLRIHHSGKLVSEPVMWYVGGEVTGVNWGWDVDFMSYIQSDAKVNVTEGNIIEGNADVSEDNDSEPEVEVDEPNVSEPEVESMSLMLVSLKLKSMSLMLKNIQL
ncbi:hypothetical protein KIW84_060633 [Lathyrus oleraceus]|uniref:Uncharacterized protein n=1 Tax=Pisum sativum TaxID=3888 RepID=A0A9D4W396_PEA|nr:hypothetical protein KIW84_060633 [Pisum sativum]